MQEIHDFIREDEVAVKAVLAGNDIINTSKYNILYTYITNVSVLKILCWKIKLEIID